MVILPTVSDPLKHKNPNAGRRASIKATRGWR